jgi:hypothetical protein
MLRETPCPQRVYVQFPAAFQPQQLHKKLGLTAQVIARRFIFTFTEISRETAFASGHSTPESSLADSFD